MKPMRNFDVSMSGVEDGVWTGGDNEEGCEREVGTFCSGGCIRGVAVAEKWLR